jgi:putative MFS transporter
MIRIIIGAATFFDAYTVLVIAFAMPQLVTQWGLTPGWVAMILSAGYVGQFIGSIIFGWLAEKIGRLPTLLITIAIFVSMDIACLFAGGATAMIVFRFLQGIGTGGEVPVASAYINEFIGARKRGRFFLLYEVIFPVGLLFAGLAGYFLVPVYGWRALFVVGLVPALLMIPLRMLMPESPRWLASRGKLDKADEVVTMLEQDAVRAGKPLPEPVVRPVDPKATAASDWRELFRGVYLKRTLMIWGLWITVYAVNNGLVTWLPTLYQQVFKLPLQTSLLYGWITSAVGVVASLVCAVYIDRVGRKRWYAVAFLLATVPLVILTAVGATTATQVVILAPIAYAILQTIAFSLYLYSAELYPTRLRAVGTGFGSAWLRAASSAGPLIVGFVVADLGIRYVFAAFAAIALVGGVITILFAVETKGRVLEELSP